MLYFIFSINVYLHYQRVLLGMLLYGGNYEALPAERGFFFDCRGRIEFKRDAIYDFKVTPF